MSTILKLTGVTKSFGSRTILNDVNITLDSGQSLALTGPSGCGKSTLLNIVGLLETSDSGTLTLNNVTYPKPNSGKAAKMRRNMISYLFQSYALIPSDTALQNVLLGMKYVNENKQHKITQAKELLARLGLEKVINDKVFTLSGGEQQRVALARCILKPGNLILADEPTGALDPQLASVVMDEILQLQHEYQKSLIVVTHDQKVAAACDHQLALA